MLIQCIFAFMLANLCSSAKVMYYAAAASVSGLPSSAFKTKLLPSCCRQISGCCCTISSCCRIVPTPRGGGRLRLGCAGISLFKYEGVDKQREKRASTGRDHGVQSKVCSLHQNRAASYLHSLRRCAASNCSRREHPAAPQGLMHFA